MGAGIKGAFIAQSALTITLASLASSSTSGQSSGVVDNHLTLYLDALLELKVKTSASALAGDKACYIYAYASIDGNVTYTDAVTGSDASFTRTDPPNLPFVGILNCPSSAATYRSRPFSIAAAFGGILPEYWGIVVINNTGQALDSTGSNHTARWQGVYAQSV